MHFDASVTVEWSAGSKAKTDKDSIWVGVALRGGTPWGTSSRNPLNGSDGSS
jgi:hypothetical protein